MVIKFLSKLVEEEKLKLVEPSEEIRDSYLEKSSSNIESARILIDNDKLEEAIALTYYSMYNMVLALFFKVGIKRENHSALIILLKELFEIDNLDISKAKEERIDKQYYTDFVIKKEEVGEAIENAEDFNNKIFDFISRISWEEVGWFRRKFERLV